MSLDIRQASWLLNGSVLRLAAYRESWTGESMDLTLIFERMGVALGLGLLVGLQRERVQSPLAGIRTFALITVLGAVAALLSLTFGGWILAVGLAGVAALLTIGNLTRPKLHTPIPGLQPKSPPWSCTL